MENKNTKNIEKYDGKIISVIKDIAFFTNSNKCYIREQKRYSDDFTIAYKELVKNKIIPDVEWDYVLLTLENLNSLINSDSKKTNSIKIKNNTVAMRNLESFVIDAAKAKASDIRLIISQNKTIRKMRVAQQEQSLKNWSENEGQEAIHAAFNAQESGSGNVTNKTNEFQSFSISNKTMSLPKNVSKLRVQTGFHETGVGIKPYLIARLFYIDADETSKFSDLGFDQQITEAFQQYFIRSKGIILIGGETGDGKSTTLARILENIYDISEGKKSIMTLEDPVEYKILGRPGVTQIPIQSAGGRALRDIKYEEALMNFLRSNPDVGMLGEIRDKVAGEQALHFASSGHSLLSTLHVNSANGILFKLIRMGISPQDVSETGIFSLLVKQSLIQILCDECKIKINENELDPIQKINIEPIFKNNVSIYARNHNGCETCKLDNEHSAWWGYKRLQAVAEYIEPNDEYNNFVAKKDPNGAKKYWLSPTKKGGLGGIEISQKLTELVLCGKASPIDVLVKKGDLSRQLSEEQRSTFKWYTP